MITTRLLSLSLLVMTVTTYAAPAVPSVPFQARIESQPRVTGECGFGCIALEIPGAGTASHMGAITISGPSQLNVIAGTQTVTTTLTAANGDTLVLDVRGTFQLSGPNVTDPVTYSGTWTVISGTGRFDGTTGTGTYSGTAAGGSGTFEMTGHISRVGGHQH